MKNTFILFLLLTAGISQAQVASTYVHAQPKLAGDMFQSNLYSADRIMEMRDKLQLTDAQATKIKKIHTENAGQFSTLKWDLDEENKKLRKMLEGSKIDQAAVSNQLESVLNLENQLKKKQLSTLVAIKNELTEEQQKILDQNQVYVFRGSGGTAPVKIVDGVAIGSSRVGGTSSSSPKVAVSVGSTGTDDQPIYYLETKSGLKKVSGFGKIDNSDIESVSVFKGDQAIEKFGKEAKNGAVVIRLKDMPE